MSSAIDTPREGERERGGGGLSTWLKPKLRVRLGRGYSLIA